jgi:two-component system chemotaxis sensor kinase CheA
MPRLNGFELTQKIREDSVLHPLPVILCTTRGSKEDKEHGIEVGANAYIDKNSFEQGHFFELIEKLI